MKTIRLKISAFLWILLSLTTASDPLFADPAWWTQPTTSIWSAGAVNTENNAAINLGQLKHVTTQAKAYLDQALAPLGAGPDVNALFPFTQDDNYAPANIGQLKNVSSKFYARLFQLGFDVRSGLVTNGVDNAIFSAQTPPWMPWDITAPATENAAIANIGQLKLVFSFDIATWASADANANGIPDWLEAYAATLPSGQDVNGDGLSDTYQLLTGSDPASTASAVSGNNATGLMVYQPLSGGL